jgi:hypothetical protein
MIIKDHAVTKLRKLFRSINRSITGRLTNYFVTITTIETLLRCPVVGSKAQRQLILISLENGIREKSPQDEAFS